MSILTREKRVRFRNICMHRSDNMDALCSCRSCVCVHASVHMTPKRMWPWIWSAVAASLFTRPKGTMTVCDQGQAGQQGASQTQLAPRDCEVSWEPPHPFWLMWERAWETGRTEALCPSLLCSCQGGACRWGRSTIGPNVSLFGVCVCELWCGWQKKGVTHVKSNL